MPGHPDAATVERIAAQVGISADQVRAVLAAAGTPAAAAPPGSRPPAPEGSERATVVSRPGGADAPAAGDRVPVGAAWAAAGVALVAMFVFVATTGGFEAHPDGKLGALLTGVVFAAAALRAAQVSRRRGFVLGEQLGLTVVAVISPVITWAVLWLLGLWPGRWVQEAAASTDGRYWVSGSDREMAAASLAVFLTPLLLAVRVLRRTHAGLALGVALLAAHPVVVALAVLAGISAPGARLGALLAASYTAGLTYLGARLESSRPDWSPWVHPFAVIGAFWLVGLVADGFGSGAGLAAGALMLAGGALLSVAWSSATHLVATGVGGAIWDFWLSEELALGPVAGLALTLTLGLGAIALAVAAWRRRRSGRSGRFGAPGRAVPGQSL